MGYCMTQSESSFIIKREKQDEALKAVKALEDPTRKWGYSWVTGKFARANDLPAALEDWRWDAETDDETGDIININFHGEKSGDDMTLWTAIAPFVEAGSYIEMRGEDGAMWRWVFDGTSVEEKSPEVKW